MKDLKNAIHIRNEYQRVASPILEHVKEVCSKFIGKKIETQKGLIAKLSEALAFDRKAIDVKPVDGAKWANVHFVQVTNSYNDMRVEISLCFNDGQTGCSYESRTFYFGKTENGVLLSINDLKLAIEPLDIETELKAIKAFREAEKVMETLQSKIKIGREVYQYIHLNHFK